MNYIKLDKELNIPLYQQLYDSFKTAIDNYELKSDQRLPSEEIICQSFNISRSVVKITYQKLEDENYIYRKAKDGSFVTPRYRYQSVLDRTPFFVDALNELDLNWSFIINLNEIKDSNKHSTISYFIDDNPFCIADINVHNSIDLERSENWEDLKFKYKHKTSFKAKLLSKFEAQFLNLNEASVVFEIKTVFYSNEEEMAVIVQWVSSSFGEIEVDVS